MFKSICLNVILAFVALTATSAASSSSSAVKREISDARVASSSYAATFPLAVTRTLGSGALSTLGYAGSLGNLYEGDDYGYAPGTGYYEYPQYAVSYSSHYVPHTTDDVFTSGFPTLGGGFAGRYPYYYDRTAGYLSRPDYYYYNRFPAYYY